MINPYFLYNENIMDTWKIVSIDSPCELINKYIETITRANLEKDMGVYPIGQMGTK